MHQCTIEKDRYTIIQYAKERGGAAVLFKGRRNDGSSTEPSVPWCRAVGGGEGCVRCRHSLMSRGSERKARISAPRSPRLASPPHTRHIGDHHDDDTVHHLPWRVSPFTVICFVLHTWHIGALFGSFIYVSRRLICNFVYRLRDAGESDREYV